jgi:sugar/nucleoside kinase (ribokinase family)
MEAIGVWEALLPAPPAEVVDPTGAGDATVGALAAGLAFRRPFLDAARGALAVGAAAVSGLGPTSLGLGSSHNDGIGSRTRRRA